MAVEKEAQPTGKLIDVDACGDGGFDVGKTIGEGEGKLFGRGASGFANVIAADRYRVPFRHLGRGVLDHVGDNPHTRPRRVDVFLLRLVLLEAVSYTHLTLPTTPYV